MNPKGGHGGPLPLLVTQNIGLQIETYLRSKSKKEYGKLTIEFFLRGKAPFLDLRTRMFFSFLHYGLCSLLLFYFSPSNFSVCYFFFVSLLTYLLYTLFLRYFIVLPNHNHNSIHLLYINKNVNSIYDFPLTTCKDFL